MEKENCNGLQAIVSQALATLKEKNGKNFDPAKVNLAELQRMTGISRSRLRRLKKNHFVVRPMAVSASMPAVPFSVVLLECSIHFCKRESQTPRYVSTGCVKQDIPGA